MSEPIDVADLPPADIARFLAFVEEQLPAFLHREASEQPDARGDVKALLNLEDRDLDKVVAVHQCLDERVLAFGHALRAGMRHPIASSTRPSETSQIVRGSIDWGATIRQRAAGGNNPSSFVTRSSERIFDTPENQALLWLIDRLTAAVATARISELDSEGNLESAAWPARINALASSLRRARRVRWLSSVEAKRPTARTLSRLKASRRRFYAEHVLRACESALAMRDPDADELSAILGKRYFRPAKNWQLFEVYVSLRLAKAFAQASPHPRRTRLLLGSGRAAYARYALADGAEISLHYQHWPAAPETSLRTEAAKRHGFTPAPSKPDLFIDRSGPDPDRVVIELKATRKSSTLGVGLSQLLGYLGERPELWERSPAAWLVAPKSDAFDAAEPGEGEQLWIVDAEEVAARAAERFACSEPAAQP